MPILRIISTVSLSKNSGSQYFKKTKKVSVTIR